FFGEDLPDGRQASTMAQQVADREIFFSGLRKLRPIARHWFVGVKLALIDEPMGTGGRQALGGGVDVHQRVAIPWASFRLVEITAPQINHRPSVDDHRDRGAKLAPFFEIFGKRLAHVLKTFVDFAFDFEFCGHLTPPWATPLYTIKPRSSLARGPAYAYTRRGPA